jgi:Na+-transporting NADH:ubiquinone oxidoreductase subunit NqrF
LLGSQSPFFYNYQVGDLVIVLHRVDAAGLVVQCGEIGIVTKIYGSGSHQSIIFDCAVKLKCGSEVDFWYGELHKLDCNG